MVYTKSKIFPRNLNIFTTAGSSLLAAKKGVESEKHILDMTLDMLTAAANTTTANSTAADKPVTAGNTPLAGILTTKSPSAERLNYRSNFIFYN